MTDSPPAPQKNPSLRRFARFHRPHAHLNSAFGDDWFALKAEAFARFFGTPVFLVGQTILVAVWIFLNVTDIWRFDVYPFILLNLAFSLQAAYAAPLILLAQTRQADRDKAMAIAEAQHREELNRFSEERQTSTGEQTLLLVRMVEQNTLLTQSNREMSERIEQLTTALLQHIMETDPAMKMPPASEPAA